jgi:transcriptional regulator MraZ
MEFLGGPQEGRARGGKGKGKGMFRGNHPAKVDEKGRLKLPAAFKQLVDAAHVTQFYITSTDGKCAEIWPLPEWEKREEQLAASSTMDDAVRKYLNLTSYYGQQVEMDAQARILLPNILRNSAKLDAEVTVFGMRTYLEVHNREAFERNLAEGALTVEDRKAMAAILSQRG